MQTDRLVQEQRTYFEKGSMRSVSARKESLEKLRSMLLENEKELCSAVHKDLHKPAMEVISAEILTAHLF